MKEFPVSVQQFQRLPLYITLDNTSLQYFVPLLKFVCSLPQDVVQDQDSDDQSELIKLGLAHNELKRGELVTVADGDGQQYVVLEVIQLEDGTEQQVAVVAPDYVEEEEAGNYVIYATNYRLRCSFTTW